MVDQQVLQGQWHQVRGKLKEKWGQLTDDDIRSFEGTTESLIGRIQQRTGETRKAIEAFLTEVTEDASDAAYKGLGRAREAVDDLASRVAESAQEGYDRMEEIVLERPGQSLLIAFGVGIVAGVGVALLFGSGSASRRMQPDALGHQLLEALRNIVPESLRGH